MGLGGERQGSCTHHFTTESTENSGLYTSGRCDEVVVINLFSRTSTEFLKEEISLLNCWEVKTLAYLERQ